MRKKSITFNHHEQYWLLQMTCNNNIINQQYNAHVQTDTHLDTFAGCFQPLPAVLGQDTEHDQAKGHDEEAEGICKLCLGRKWAVRLGSAVATAEHRGDICQRGFSTFRPCEHCVRWFVISTAFLLTIRIIRIADYCTIAFAHTGN